jgi:hypothetical protein
MNLEYRNGQFWDNDTNSRVDWDALRRQREKELKRLASEKKQRRQEFDDFVNGIVDKRYKRKKFERRRKPRK